MQNYAKQLIHAHNTHDTWQVHYARQKLPLEPHLLSELWPDSGLPCPFDVAAQMLKTFSWVWRRVLVITAKRKCQITKLCEMQIPTKEIFVFPRVDDRTAATGRREPETPEDTGTIKWVVCPINRNYIKWGQSFLTANFGFDIQKCI